MAAGTRGRRAMRDLWNNWIPGLQCTATRFRLRQGFRLRAARFRLRPSGYGAHVETPLSAYALTRDGATGRGSSVRTR